MFRNPNARAALLSLAIFAFVLGLADIPILVTGCSSVNRSAYVATSAAQVTVQEALTFWNDQFVKPGKSTIAQEQTVKALYLKVQAAALALCDAGAAYSAAARQTGTTVTTQVEAALVQATTNFNNERADFLNLLTSFGVKIPGLNS